MIIHILRSVRIPAILLVFSTSIFARIGETLDQCAARYGKAKVTETGSYEFLKGDFDVEATFDKGICVEITYSLENDKPIPLPKIQECLTENSGAVEWTLADVEDGTTWETTDGKLRAIYLAGELPFLFITDLAFDKARAIKTEEAKRSRGWVDRLFDTGLGRLFIVALFFGGFIGLCCLKDRFNVWCGTP